MKGHEKASNFSINRKKKRICENNSPSWPFLSLRLEFIQFFYSCFCDISSTQSLHIARKILVSFAILNSRKNPCYFCSLEFCFIGFSTHAIFAGDCLTKFSVNYFLCENCGENLLTRSFLVTYIAFCFGFTVLYALPRHTIQTVKQGRGGS